MAEIEGILRSDPTRMYSKEEILNLLVRMNRDNDIEHFLAELEIASSLEKSKSHVYSTCRGGTVYYRWNRKI